MPGIANDSRLGIEGVIAARLDRARLRAGYRDLLLRVLTLALIVFLVFTFGFMICRNHGQAMAPAMKDGDLCVIYRTEAQTLMGLTFAAGDVVAWRSGDDRHIGRVVAVQGDTINRSSDGYLTVNGALSVGRMTDQHAQAGSEYPITVPQNAVYVLCDDTEAAPDSRDEGPIPLSRVEGKVITILRRRGI